MLPLVGGPDHGDCLLPLLEQLASMEETVVRDNVCYAWALSRCYITILRRQTSRSV
jgi:hypothetical protein